jgi:hypothetical protein
MKKGNKRGGMYVGREQKSTEVFQKRADENEKKIDDEAEIISTTRRALQRTIELGEAKRIWIIEKKSTESEVRSKSKNGAKSKKHRALQRTIEFARAKRIELVEKNSRKKKTQKSQNVSEDTASVGIEGRIGFNDMMENRMSNLYERAKICTKNKSPKISIRRKIKRNYITGEEMSHRKERAKERRARRIAIRKEKERKKTIWGVQREDPKRYL